MHIYCCVNPKRRIELWKDDLGACPATALVEQVKDVSARGRRPFAPASAQAVVATQGAADLLSRALRRAVAAFIGEGLDLIVSGILPYGDPEGAADTLALFRRCRLCYVGVHCNLEVLEERERQRPGRESGWARRQYADLHEGADYAIEVDTTCATPKECAEQIQQYLAKQDQTLR